MARYKLTKAAEHDLDAIWKYTDRHYGRNQARRYFNTIRDKIKFLAQNPQTGSPRNDIAVHCRVSPEGKHLIFYREMKDHIQIIRVLHQRMDPEANL